ncbi:beta-N-acetylglucosaminidase domain-containing protein [Georgenia faecalis]|uniref:beta-N-acetylglucosaminidase domain-containing protein n=1 Tax=Georgenia faecalis TaxID=2483799 RepID=UPI0013E01DAD|nr:beta-N-acetylglucosaminidase domain-containing protein [Georgenia faecalis]
MNVAIPRSTPGRRRAVGLAAAAAVACAVLTPAGLTAAPAEAVEGVPDIYPVPLAIAAEGVPVSLAGPVTIVVGEGADASAVEALEEIVAAAGGAATVAPAAGPGVDVYLGTTAANPEIATLLDAFDVANAEGLNGDGYVIANGTHDGAPVLVLNGVDDTGSYYATQTLRQVVQDGTVPAFRVRDMPLMSVRGAIEGFYGIPWSHQARLDLLEYSGEHKMNTYIYTPKDDLLLRANWRELYEGDELAQIAELIDQANRHHVDFTFALSPGNSICYSSEEDYQATINKFEQLRDLGVDSFYIALDDIPWELRCAADQAAYPNQTALLALADAQTDYLNRVQREWVEPEGLEPLQTVPTLYDGSAPDQWGYKARFGERLDEDVLIQWTGEGVFSDTITVESVQRASETYRTDHLYIWDNFPVNDGRRNRLFLNPLTGRAPELYQHIDGITSNPLIQPYASLPALGNYADYSWNPLAYDAEASMAHALAELAGPDPAVQAALTAFADLNQSWPYREDVVYAPALSADVEAFWDAYEAGEDAGRTALRERLALIASLPEVLPQMAEPGFAVDVEPWADAAAQWADALLHETDMLAALEDRYGNPATEALFAAQDDIALTTRPTVDDAGGDGVPQPDRIVPAVGDGVFDAFSEEAMDAYVEWLGAEPLGPGTGYPATPSSSMGTWQDFSTARMVDGNLGTLYWSNQAGTSGQHVQVDLGAVREIGRIAVHQSDGDTQTGDMFYNAVLRYSTDGTSWTDVGQYTASPLITHQFDVPVQARFVRLAASASNPGGQWVKIREFIVSAPSTEFESNLPNAVNEGVQRAFDGDVETAYQAAEAPVEGSHITRNFAEARPVGSVAVVGTGVGEIQVEVDGEWVTVGELTEGDVFHETAVDVDGPVTAVRLVLEAGSDAPRIVEVVAREGGPVGVPEPTEPPTTEPPTTEPPTTEPPTTEPPTTEPPTTEPPTTEPPTTEPPTTEPPTTEPPSGGTDPTADPGPTGGVDPSGDGSGRPTAPGGGDLPSTGATGATTGLLAAVGLLLAGLAGVLVTRRRVAVRG